MKTRLGHIIGCVTEEAGEVSQAVGKIIRFGLDDRKFVEGNTNLENLKAEVHDLVAAYQMMCDELGQDPQLNQVRLLAKKAKVEDYIQYAKDIGQLDTEESV